MKPRRSIALVGAPTSIGIKPYDSGEPRGLDQAPGALRRLGLARRIAVTDTGDVIPPPYRDFELRPGNVRNESEIISYTAALAEHIADPVSRGEFVLVIGGDCSIVLGGLLGVRRAGLRPVGLAYIDGHADFATPSESLTGSAASMCLSLAVGRGDTPLSRLGGEPLVESRHVALVGRRDEAEPWYGHEALRQSSILDVPHVQIGRGGYGKIAHRVLDQIAYEELEGFWIHVDADVLDPAIMPAVDSPEAGGPNLKELAELLRPLAAHPKALGIELTIYDPKLDSGEICGERLVGLLSDVLGD